MTLAKPKRPSGFAGIMDSISLIFTITCPQSRLHLKKKSAVLSINDIHIIMIAYLIEKLSKVTSIGVVGNLPLRGMTVFGRETGLIHAP